MTTLKLLSLLMTLAFSSLAWSSDCELPSGGPVTRVLFKGAKDCVFAQSLAHKLLEVSQHFPESPKVTLVIGERSTNASFDNGHIIWLPRHLISVDPSGQEHIAETEQLLKVVVHEYGHALLNVTLKKHFTEEFSELYEGFASLSADAESNIIEKISPRGIRTRGGELAQTEAFQLYYKNIPAFSELYADALTVFAFDDTAAMKQALHFARQDARKSAQVRLRDFSIEHSLEEINNSNDDHTRLSLVRSYLGRVWQKKSALEKRELLEKLRAAIVVSLRENLHQSKMRSNGDRNMQVISHLEND